MWGAHTAQLKARALLCVALACLEGQGGAVDVAEACGRHQVQAPAAQRADAEAAALARPSSSGL